MYSGAVYGDILYIPGCQLFKNIYLFSMSRKSGLWYQFEEGVRAVSIGCDGEKQLRYSDGGVVCHGRFLGI